MIFSGYRFGVSLSLGMALFVLITKISGIPHESFDRHDKCKEKCAGEDKKAAEESRYECGAHGKPLLPCYRQCFGLALSGDQSICWCRHCKMRKGRQYCGADKNYIKASDCEELVCQGEMKAKYSPETCKDPNPSANPSVDNDDDDDDRR